MPAPAEIVREIHRLRRAVHTLQTEIDRLPQRLKIEQAKVTRQEDALREGQETIKRLKVTTLEKESNLRTKNQQIAKHEKQLNEATSKKEYDVLRDEIIAEKKSCRDLEDEILEVMEETETWTNKLPELEAAIQRAKEELARFEEGARARHASLAEQLAQAIRDLKAVEVTLPEEHRLVYDRLTAARGDDALSVVQNRTCSACYTEITAQNYHELVLGQFVLCKSCGRILYLPE
jgi:predicted  nucleic acid-binding Zn-ribbon protein